MRQTNSAITMLLAEYRAIYRQAFYLGIATTIFVGGSVFSSYVFAADVQDQHIQQRSVIEINQEEKITDQVKRYDEDVKITSTGNLNIVSKDKWTYSHAFINKDIDFEKGGQINVGAKDAKGLSTAYLTDGKVNNGQNATINIKANGRLNVSNDNFIKLKEGKITLESDDLTNQATIEIVGGNVTLKDSDFSDGTQKGISQKGTLTGNSKEKSYTLTIEGSNNQVDLTENKSHFDKDKTKFSFQNIHLKGKSAQVDNATLSVNNDLRVGENTIGDLSGKNLKLEFLHISKNPKKINVNKIDLNGESSITLKGGAWDFHDMDVSVENNNSNAIFINKNADAQHINNLLIKRGKAVVSGKLDTKKFELQNDATLDLSDGATFVITGTDATDDIKISNTTNNKINVEKGSRLILDRKAVDDIYDIKTKEFTEAGKKFAEQYHADSSAILELAYEDHVQLDESDIEKITTQFKNNKGYISLGNAEIKTPSGLQGKTTWSRAYKYASLQVTNDELKNARITVSKDEFNKTQGLYGAFGSFDVNSDAVSNNTVDLTKNTILSNAKGNSDGKSFVKVGNETANVKVDSRVSLTLANGGDINNVELLEKGNLTIVGNDGDVTNLNSIKSEQNKITSTSFNGGTVNVKESIDTTTLDTINSKINVKENINVEEFNTINSSYDVDGNITFDKRASINSSNIKAKKIIIKTNNNGTTVAINNGSNIHVDEIDTPNIGVYFKIGENEAKSSFTRDEKTNNTNGSNAHVFIKKGESFKLYSVDIQSGDNDYSSLVFGDTNINTRIKVRDNSVVAYGFDSTADLEKSLEDNFLKNANGSIKDNKALLYLNKSITLEDNKGISLNAGDQTQDNITLGLNSGIVITDKAIEDANSKGQAVIQSNKNFKVQLTDQNTDETHVVLAGKFSAFDENQTIKIFGDEVQLEQDLKVKAAQGQLSGTIGKDSNSLDSLVIDKDAVAKVNYNSSVPIKSYIEKIILDEKGFTNKDFIKTEVGKRVDDLAYSLAGGNTVDTEGGKSLEQASRFALYGSSFKATDNAMKMQQDSLEGYINKAMAMSASNGELGSFFITPNVISSDVKDLDAQGLTYGTKGTLYGLTMGSSFIARGDLQFGALASFGKGKYDGQGSANGVKNDYDFYGVGAFASFVNNNFSLTSDINYVKGKSEITADIIGSDTYRKFNADVDSSVLSLGINGAYRFNLDKVSLTPSLGVRYSTYDIDDYDLRADNDVFMQNKFETMSVLSVPLALVLNSEFSDGSWVVNPSLSLGVTFNLGDKNVENKSTIVSKYDGMNLTTQVLDKVVLGVRGGLKAQKDDLTMGFYVNYQGSNKTKDLGLSVDANYLF